MGPCKAPKEMINKSDPNVHKTANFRGFKASTGMMKKHRAKQATAPSRQIPNTKSLSQYDNVNHAGSSTVSSETVAATLGEIPFVSVVELKIPPNLPLFVLLAVDGPGSLVGKAMCSSCLKGFRLEILFIISEAPDPMLDEEGICKDPRQDDNWDLNACSKSRTLCLVLK